MTGFSLKIAMVLTLKAHPLKPFSAAQIQSELGGDPRELEHINEVFAQLIRQDQYLGAEIDGFWTVLAALPVEIWEGWYLGDTFTGYLRSTLYAMSEAEASDIDVDGRHVRATRSSAKLVLHYTPLKESS